VNLFLTNPPDTFERGLAAFCDLHQITLCTKGTPFTVHISSEQRLTLIKDEAGVHCTLPSHHLLYRALTVLKAHQSEQSFAISEPVHLKTLAAMFDGSQASSLMTVSSVKKMLLYLAGMGYNMLLLYCEDCFELSGEPYWGNMRPRYTQADFRELDDFAFSLGIEMVPCVQTLAHLTDAIKRPPYAKMADTASVLMVGDERVYTLIDKIVTEISACFRSRRIHIGMDEAWDLGLGNYMKKNGYTPSGELVKRHLLRVMDIVREKGLSPMMWADMFFRARSKSAAYRDPDVCFEEQDREMIPQDMHIVYWDYYQLERAGYEHMLQKALFLTKNTIFAGCARNVRTFGSHNQKTFATTAAAMNACKHLGIREVIATVWGDDHRESSNFAVLMGLCCFAEHAFGDSTTTEVIRTRTKETTGIDPEVFDHIDALDCFPDYNGDNIENISLTRAIIWQDPLLGLFDNELGRFDFATHYRHVAQALEADANALPHFATLLRFYACVARTCAEKAGLGIALTDAYAANDREALKTLCEVTLPQLTKTVAALHEAHRKYFFEEYKPIGFEVLDIRYGGVLARLQTTVSRLSSYLSDEIDRIEELEEPRLPFGETGKVKHTLHYLQICSASRV